jgi:hypothetical protein
VEFMHVNHVRIKGLPYFADICFLWLSRIRRLVLSLFLSRAMSIERGFALTCIFYIKFGVCALVRCKIISGLKAMNVKSLILMPLKVYREHGRQAFYGRQNVCPFFMNLLSLVLVCAAAQQAHPFALMELMQNYKQLNWHALFVQTLKAYLQRVPSSAD